MLNLKHSTWLPATKTQSAKQGPTPQATTTKSQTRYEPTTTTTRKTESTTTNHHRNRYQPTTKQFIQLKTSTLPRSGRTILVTRPRPQKQSPKPLFLRNCEILSQESLIQLLNQNQLLNQTQLLNQAQLLHQAQLLNRLNQRATNPQIQKSPSERIIQIPSAQEDGQEITPTPIYKIISVPFLTRSFLPPPSIKQRNSITNGLVETKKVALNRNGNDGQILTHGLGQENTLTRSNLLKQQQKNRDQLNTLAAKTSNTTPASLNTTRTPITTTPSTTMMGIQLPGSEFQDMSGVLPIAAVEELMAPVYLDDYFIETNNNSDFDTNKGTYKLNGLDEMTINQMNVEFAGKLQSKDGQEEQLMRDVPGEEEIYNRLREQNSEELVTLTQSNYSHETLESELLLTQLFDNTTCNNSLITNSEDSDNSSSYMAMPPGSPLPTKNDCIATANLHTHTRYADEIFMESLQDDETSSYGLQSTAQLYGEHSPVSCGSGIMKDEQSWDLAQIIEQLTKSEEEQQQQKSNLKRNSDHLSNIQIKHAGAKKSRLSIPVAGLVLAGSDGGFGSTKVPDTPEVCEMVDYWLQSASTTEGNDTSTSSHSPTPSWGDTSFVLPESNTDTIVLIDPKYENPPSIASSFAYEEPAYATPSPSNSSSCTLYSTNPNSPAVSACGNGRSARKPRGRPPKQHSDLPDPEVWRRLPETERKRYEDRCKNNEASRQSRQKNKEKQAQLQAEEEFEQQRNDELNNKMKALDREHRKLKKVLYRKFNSD